MKKLFIGNIPHTVSESAIHELFEEFGPLLSCRLIKDRDTGHSRGFAFIEFEDDAKAGAAIQARNGQLFGDRELSVAEARDRNEKAEKQAHPKGGRAPLRKTGAPMRAPRPASRSQEPER